jgi:hypothetical protein
MTELKRLEVKYIRDGAKAAYTKDVECFICGETEELQLHHFYTINILWENYKRKNKIKIETVEDILAIRDVFVQDHYEEIYNEVVTLCKFHHMERLHKVYGKVPPLATAKKQKNWCEIRREKEYNT